VKLRLLPDTLFGRLLGALLAVVGVTLLVIVLLIVRERRDLALLGGEASAIVNAIAATSTELASLQPEARSAEIARLQAEPLRVMRRAQPAEVAPLAPRDVAVAMRVVGARLMRELGDSYGVSVRLARPGRGDVIRLRSQNERAARSAEPNGFGAGGAEPNRDRMRPMGPQADRDGDGALRRFRGTPGGFGRELDVRVVLPDGDLVTFRTDVPRAGPPLPRGIFVQLLALTAVLALVLYAMARTISRPLTDLARAADAVGRGERSPPLKETGARELREATRAFNAMQERLNRYLDSRTHVLAAMSHDLRTPLTRLKLRVESIDDPVQRERFTADLDEMNDMVTGALALFKGLNEDEAAVPVRIEAMLEEVRKEFAELGAAFAITGASTGPIAAKPGALKRCLTNLLSNALKYGKNVAVSIEDGADLVLRVTDEGPGIPDEMLERVFEPFFRLESSRSSETGGTGLGLSIARDVAQAHGGSLVLRNRVPHGLEAELRLPRASKRPVAAS
jgi:signal transduction histidine kinase